MSSKEPRSWTRNANWVWKGRAVGGELTVTDAELVFDPHAIERNPSKFAAVLNAFARIVFDANPIPNDEYDPAEQLRVNLDAVRSVETEPPRQRGLQDTVYAGGLRSRMRIELEDGSEELFVIGNLKESIDEIRSAADTGTSR